MAYKTELWGFIICANIATIGGHYAFTGIYIAAALVVLMVSVNTRTTRGEGE